MAGEALLARYALTNMGRSLSGQGFVSWRSLQQDGVGDVRKGP